MLKIVSIIFIFCFSFQKLFANEYFLTLRNDKVNLRQGPSFEYPIKLFYKKKFLPVLVQDKSEMYTNPSIPSSSSMKTPKFVKFLTNPVCFDPSGYFDVMSVHGSGEICFIPSLMLLLKKVDYARFISVKMNGVK